jgi:putative ABC transport system permease protein
MNLVTIAWKSIRQRWLASSLTALSIALGVALMVAVLVVNGVVTRMFNQNATGFHLIVGAKGSKMQLVLNTIFFLDQPIENIPYKYYLDLKNNKAFAHAIPFALGDTTEDGKFRIVGTIPEYFTLEYVPRKQFQFSQGKPLEGTFDAVIGARVARAYGWNVGHKFPIAHGGNLGDIHDEKFTVAGILAPTGLPLDRAVFIHYDGFYEIAGHGMSEKEAEIEKQARESGQMILPEVLPDTAAAPVVKKRDGGSVKDGRQRARPAGRAGLLHEAQDQQGLDRAGRRPDGTDHQIAARRGGQCPDHVAGDDGAHHHRFGSRDLRQHL